jgi:hypothetical protein
MYIYVICGKATRKKSLGRSRRRQVDNIGMDFGDRGWSDVDWIGLASDRNHWRALVSVVMKHGKPYTS